MMKFCRHWLHIHDVLVRWPSFLLKERPCTQTKLNGPSKEVMLISLISRYVLALVNFQLADGNASKTPQFYMVFQVIFFYVNWLYFCISLACLCCWILETWQLTGPTPAEQNLLLSGLSQLALSVRSRIVYFLIYLHFRSDSKVQIDLLLYYLKHRHETPLVVQVFWNWWSCKIREFCVSGLEPLVWRKSLFLACVKWPI